MSSALIYKMRLTAPNKPGTASHNSNYVKYIAEREHVMKLSPESESGLFGRIDGTNNDELDVTDTQNYVYGISKAGVTVYNAYISFRPEIAKRLELDSLEKWQNYIKFHIETLMRGYDIPKDRFEYIAAVHDKKGQPHIHISFWDKDPPVTVQFVKKEVSDNVRKKLIHDTFANELSYYYGISNEAMSDAKELVGKLMIDFERDISGIYSNRFSGVDIPEELIQKYTDVLNNLPGRGRIAYAYLPKETKDMVIGMIRDWEEEADTFISEWRKATDADPTFDDVLKEANSIGEKEISEMSDNGRRYSENTPKKYAETLWGYINDILEKEKEEEMEI